MCSGKLEEQPNKHPAQEKDPLPEFPDGVNPKTGEVGGPKARLNVLPKIRNLFFAKRQFPSGN